MKKLFFILCCLTLFSCSKEDNGPATETITQYTITVSSTTGGSVSTPGGTYNSGAIVTVTATPEEGYRFTGWTGSSSTEPTLSITLNQNQSLVANFERIYELESTIQGNWIISSSSTTGKNSCRIFNLTFTNTGEFTIVYSGGIETGNYQVTSETEISLGTAGVITNIAVVDGVITFNITIIQCEVSAEGERNEDYEEGGCTNFLECYAGEYTNHEDPQGSECSSREYLKINNDINNKWLESVLDVCDYDRRYCRNYVSNLTSDLSSGEFLTQRPYGYRTNYEIVELGFDYIIIKSQWNQSWDNSSLIKYSLMKGYDEGLSYQESNDLEGVYQLLDSASEHSVVYLTEETNIFDNVDEIDNCDSCYFLDNDYNIGCGNFFVAFEDKVAERNGKDVTIGESVFFPNNEVFYVAAEYPILSSAWATHISNWGVPSEGAIRVVLVKDQTKIGNNYNHEESPERYYLHYRYEDKRFLYAIDPKVESVPQDDLVWYYQLPNSEGVVGDSMSDLWAAFVAYLVNPSQNRTFLETYNNTTWYDSDTGHYLYFRNDPLNFLKKVTQGGEVLCFTYNIGQLNYYVDGAFIPSTVVETESNSNNISFSITYDLNGVSTVKNISYTLLPNNTLRERYGLPNSEDYIENSYTISNFDTSTICD